MFKRFDDYSAALDFGRKIGQELGCFVHCVTVYVPLPGPLPEGHSESARPSATVAFVATPSDYHKLHGHRGASYSGGGWWFGDTGRMAKDSAAILAEADSPALPDKGEYWFGMFAAYTSGFTREEILEMVVEVQKNNSCVWHESAMLARRKHPDRKIECHCGKCKPKPAAPVASPPRPRGRGKFRLGRHSGY